MNLITILFLFITLPTCKNNSSDVSVQGDEKQIQNIFFNPPEDSVITGAERLTEYLPLIQNKNVALVINQTSLVDHTHLLDTLIALDVNVVKIFSPEHGFRGEDDAGKKINNSIDVTSGLPIVSLYGSSKKLSSEQLNNIDIVIYDIQDVGVRFYTYISTMHYVMEACAENNIKLIVLDRPNPNGYYVDGPVLQKGFESFIGMHPVPVVYGLTAGEFALMINNEGWLQNNIQCNLQVITCTNYDHNANYKLPVAPSPNLKTMKAIYLYPTLCFFEGTTVSVGRGTTSPFEIYGSPHIPPTDFSFIPKPSPGASAPFLDGEICNGFSYTDESIDLIREDKFNLDHLIKMYELFTDKNKFFLQNNFFNKLAGNDILMRQIKAGLSSNEIKLSWEDDLENYKEIRKKYLLYPDFDEQ